MDCIHRLRSRATTRFAFRTAAALATLAFFALALAVFGRPAFAARPLVVSPVPPGDAVALVINDQQLWLDDQPFIDGGSTMLPFRALFETVGASVTYDPETHVITARRSLPQGGERVVVMTVGSTEAIVDGQPKTLDVPPKLYGSRVFIPLRFASEALGARAEWIESWREARVTIDGTLQAGTGVRLPLYTQEYGNDARLVFYGLEPTDERPVNAEPDDTRKWQKLYASGNFDRNRFGKAQLDTLEPYPLSEVDNPNPPASARQMFTANPYLKPGEWEPLPTVPNATPVLVESKAEAVPLIGLRLFEDRRDVIRVPYDEAPVPVGVPLPTPPGAQPPYEFRVWAARRANGGSLITGIYTSGYMYPVAPFLTRIPGGPWQVPTFIHGGWAFAGQSAVGYVEMQLQGWWRLAGDPLVLAPSTVRPVPIFWGPEAGEYIPGLTWMLL